MRRRLHPDARRAELIDAALRILRQRGDADCRVEDITAAARAAKGTLYLYFPSWEELLVAVRNRILDDYAAEVRGRLERHTAGDWKALLDDECVRFVDFVVDLGGLHQAIFHGPIADRPIEGDRSAVHLIAGFLRLGIEAGALRPVNEEAAARLLFSMLHSTADAIAQGADRDTFLNGTRDLVHHWLWP